MMFELKAQCDVGEAEVDPAGIVGAIWHFSNENRIKKKKGKIRKIT